MGKFWDWHKKMWNDPTPILQVSSRDDGRGNKAFGIKLGHSHFMQWEGVPENEIDFNRHELGFRKRPKQLEAYEPELLE